MADHDHTPDEAVERDPTLDEAVERDPTSDEAIGGPHEDTGGPAHGSADAGPDEAPVVDRGGEWMDRWNEIQIRFVDEPRQSIEDADTLVDEVVKQLTATFADERAHLEEQWSAGSEPSTEDLRLALQRYRSFFHRLLAA